MGAQWSSIVHGLALEDYLPPETADALAIMYFKTKRVFRTAYWLGGQTCWIMSTGLLVLVAPALAEFDRECSHFELTAALQAAQMQQQQMGAPM
ncbi:unnamed protein product [Amoebophrya sp. A25]|nr:unnamed protein product [Amoebophrya sp. A25]|eukprot:GSA25T00013628001.1